VSGVCRCPEQCQGYAGALSSVRGMQVPRSVSVVCRYPDQCQRYAGTLTRVRGMQISGGVSGASRYPAGIPTIVRGTQKLAYSVFDISGRVIKGEILLALMYPIKTV